MNVYQLTNHYISKGIPIVVVSATEKVGDGPVEVGKKMLVLQNKEAFGTVGGGALEFTAREYCAEVFKTKQSETKTYLLNEGKVLKDATTLPMACGGKVTLYFEYIGYNEHIYIFGAGHVSKALTKVLSTMNFKITVIDDRADVINELEGATEKITISFDQYIEEYGLEENSFVVVCTPSHKFDFKVVNKVFENQLKLKYLGMLCSIKKLDEYLKATYERFTKQIDLSYFYAPVGLDTGGGSPEEIAISISSEILAVSAGKKGHNHMREKYKDKYWK